jgi:hypothetical protein
MAGVLGALAALPLQAYLLSHEFIDGAQLGFLSPALRYAAWPIVVGGYLSWARLHNVESDESGSLGFGSGLSEVIGLLPVAALFVFTGAWSAYLCGGTVQPRGTNLLLIPLPFAVPAAILFLRSWKSAIAAPLFVAVWAVAWCVACFGLVLLLPMLVGGVIGGLGLALACAVGRPRILAHIRSAAIVGGLAALPFEVCFLVQSVGGDRGGAGRWSYTELAIGFGAWQSVAGSYLYRLCSQIRDED